MFLYLCVYVSIEDWNLGVSMIVISYVVSEVNEFSDVLR